MLCFAASYNSDQKVEAAVPAWVLMILVSAAIAAAIVLGLWDNLPAAPPGWRAERAQLVEQAATGAQTDIQGLNHMPMPGTSAAAAAGANISSQRRMPSAFTDAERAALGPLLPYAKPMKATRVKQPWRELSANAKRGLAAYNETRNHARMLQPPPLLEDDDEGVADYPQVSYAFMQPLHGHVVDGSWLLVISYGLCSSAGLWSGLVYSHEHFLLRTKLLHAVHLTCMTCRVGT